MINMDSLPHLLRSMFFEPNPKRHMDVFPITSCTQVRFLDFRAFILIPNRQRVSSQWKNRVRLELPPRLGRKADQILSVYGGIKGLSAQPAWLASAVLKAFFSVEEREQIEKFLLAKQHAR